MDNNFNDAASVTTFRKTSEGYLAGSVRCARVGVQVYQRKELGMTGDGLITLYRPETSVFDKDSLSTYAGKPITLGHPKENVSPENWKNLAVGTVGSKVLRDGEAVVVDFSIMDAATIRAIEDGTRQVSMGYTTPIAMQDGVTPDGEPYQAIQTGPIRINHLAVVKHARGGDLLRIGDSMEDHWGATPFNTEKQQELPMSMKPVVLGDAAVQVALTDAALVEAFRDRMTSVIVEKDTEIGRLKAEKKTLEDSVVTPEKLTKMIADRVALQDLAAKVSPGMVCDGLTDEQIQRTAVVERFGETSVQDSSPAEIRGMFKALCANVPATGNDPVRDAFRGVAKISDAATSSGWSNEAYAKAGVKMKKGN